MDPLPVSARGARPVVLQAWPPLIAKRLSFQHDFAPLHPVGLPSPSSGRPSMDATGGPRRRKSALDLIDPIQAPGCGAATPPGSRWADRDGSLVVQGQVARLALGPALCLQA